jgi:hypothetical protein
MVEKYFNLILNGRTFEFNKAMNKISSGMII